MTTPIPSLTFTESASTRFCKDCVYMLREASGTGSMLRFARCGHASSLDERAAQAEYLTTGQRIPFRPLEYFQYCTVEREGHKPTQCGPDGKHYAPKILPLPSASTGWYGWVKQRLVAVLAKPTFRNRSHRATVTYYPFDHHPTERDLTHDR